MDLEKAYKFCEKLATEHYENFPVGSVLFPKKSRKYIYAIYAFARTADDIADSDKISPEDKLSKLNEMDSKLDKIYNNESVEDEIFIALKDTMDAVNIPVKEFKDLLTAFKQDSVKQKYDEFDELIEYSKYSANPIGHLVLYVSGINDEKLFKLSDYICTALQLANFWQDVSVDLNMGRIYIPNKEMAKYNYNYALLNERKENNDFINLIKSLVDRTKDLFYKGKELDKYMHGRLKYELRTMYRGGMSILEKIEKMEYKVLSKRVVICSSDKYKLLLKIFCKI
jgi:hydroxysqualene synthase